eukprot:4127498-Amphidinium_carterae.1
MLPEYYINMLSLIASCAPLQSSEITCCYCTHGRHISNLAQYVSLHVPLTPETKDSINKVAMQS